MSDASRQEVENGLEELLPRLWRFAMSITRRHDAAEDLVQMTCVRALSQADRYQPGTRLDRWSFTLMINLWRSHQRREGRSISEDIELHELSAPASQSPESVLFNRQVIQAIDSLPVEQRIIVTMVYGEGWTYREAAEVLSVPIGTVMSRLHAARKKLAHLSSK
ncbi:MAG: RNA polymerase sigma factor [Pseudomonadota bacterium]